ncbi:shikimate kinase [Christensenellaceae bacterium OttesenSCG-928-K19]|nr:shikimate kinase [Christensenellaceae bacterium OttesenSCG-928-K19]
MNNIYLTGMMGSGKSAIGKCLAMHTGGEFVDTDTLIEQREGKTINEIFAESGEGGFRKIETDVLAQVSKRNGLIVSCGGGVILSDTNIVLMKDTGSIVYIERAIEEIIKDVKTETRPLLQKDGTNIRKIFKKRKARYENSYDVKVKNTGSIENAAVFIKNRLNL